MKIRIGQVYEILQGTETVLLYLVQASANAIIALAVQDTTLEIVSCNRWSGAPVKVVSPFDISDEELAKILGSEKWEFKGALAIISCERIVKYYTCVWLCHDMGWTARGIINGLNDKSLIMKNGEIIDPILPLGRQVVAYYGNNDSCKTNIEEFERSDSSNFRLGLS